MRNVSPVENSRHLRRRHWFPLEWWPREMSAVFISRAGGNGINICFYKHVYSTITFLHLSMEKVLYPISGKPLHIRHFIHLFSLRGVRVRVLNCQEVVISFMRSFCLIEEKDQVQYKADTFIYGKRQASCVKTICTKSPSFPCYLSYSFYHYIITTNTNYLQFLLKSFICRFSNLS